MKNLRGDHSTFIPLAKDIIESIKKKNKNAEFSSGFIESGIKAKTRSITIFLENNSVIKLNIVSTASKQSIRVYNSNLSEIKKVLKELHLPFREREVATKLMK